VNYQAARLGLRCKPRGGFHLDVDFGAVRLVDEREIEVGFSNSIPTMRGGYARTVVTPSAEDHALGGHPKPAIDGHLKTGHRK